MSSRYHILLIYSCILVTQIESGTKKADTRAGFIRLKLTPQNVYFACSEK